MLKKALFITVKWVCRELLGLEPLYQRVTRGRLEPDIIRRMVENDLGRVEGVRVLGGIHPSPFKGLRIYPMLYECRARYASTRGSWFIRTSSRPVVFEWVWCDELNNPHLPSTTIQGEVRNGLHPRSYLADSIRIFGMIAFGLAIAMTLWWLYF